VNKTRYHALVVDDNEPTRILIGRILEQELGLQVSLAGTCEVALRMVEEETFDIILLDLLMPGVGGFGVLKLIRAESANTDTPVVIVSVLDDKPSIDHCMELKAQAFVVKPVNRPVLAGVVKAHLPGAPKRPHDEQRAQPR
jgi:DNA-binding response OmpR family regulator